MNRFNQPDTPAHFRHRTEILGPVTVAGDILFRDFVCAMSDHKSASGRSMDEAEALWLIALNQFDFDIEDTAQICWKPRLLVITEQVVDQDAEKDSNGILVGGKGSILEKIMIVGGTIPVTV
jgi:hypothetical protein